MKMTKEAFRKIKESEGIKDGIIGNEEGFNEWKVATFILLGLILATSIAYYTSNVSSSNFLDRNISLGYGMNMSSYELNFIYTHKWSGDRVTICDIRTKECLTAMKKILMKNETKS